MSTSQLFIGGRELLPGPYEAREVEIVLVPVCFTRVVNIPPGARNILRFPWTLGYLYLSRYADFGHKRVRDLDGTEYMEVALLRPALVGCARYLYVQQIQPNNQQALCVGREIYGDPKTWGPVDWREGRVRMRRGAQLFDVGWESLEEDHWSDGIFSEIFNVAGPAFLDAGTSSLADIVEAGFGMNLIGHRVVHDFSGGTYLDGLVRTRLQVDSIRLAEVRKALEPRKPLVLPGAGPLPWLGSRGYRVIGTASLEPAGDAIL